MEQGIIEQFVNTIKQEPNDKKTTYGAIVSRIDEEGVIWVYVAGADKDTPTAQTGVEVSKGDHVTVEWQNNKLYIAGNYSNPSAGVVRVAQVELASKVANEAAEQAVSDAGRAREAAESAQEDAVKAQESAGIAKDAADDALKGLGKVEDVVGVLDWITTHSKVTDDTTPTVGKSYYIKRPDGTFVLVTDVEGKNPHEEGWYELDEAIQNYIMSHLALTDDGLYVMKDGTKWKVLITNGGVYILDENDNKVAQYEDIIVVGREDGNNVLIDPNGMKIRDRLTEVAIFAEELIELAKNSEASKIRLCADVGLIEVGVDNLGRKVLYIENTESQNSRLCLICGGGFIGISHNSIQMEAGSNSIHLDSEMTIDFNELYLNNAKLDDFVTKIGVSGNWVYRWWASGRREAWCTYTGSSATANAWVSPLRYRDININIPTNVFGSAPRVYATSYNNQAWVVSANASSETALSVRIATVSSSAITPSLRLYCVQG